MSIFEDWEEASHWPKIEPVSYRFIDEYWGDVFITCTHYEKRTWKIAQGTGVPAPCISKSDKCFQYEPPPSARSEEYLEDTRFESIVLALMFWTEHKEAIQSTHFRHPKFKETLP